MERYYIRMEVVIMSFFDEMKESLVSAGKDVSQKAKEVSGVAKLKLDVKSKEDYVEKQYWDVLILMHTEMMRKMPKMNSSK